MPKVIEFITVPESSLSFVFLIIFTIIFIYGIYRIRKDKAVVENTIDSIIDEYHGNHSKYDAEVFFERKADKIKINDGYIDDLPNLFVSIGILGTFIGLGIAIQGAAELLNDETVDLHQLNAVLGIIAFKFQTSVWGTIFSIIFREGFLESYFIKRQNMLADLRENLLNIEKETTRTLLSKQLSGIDDMKAILSDFNDVFYQKMDTFSSYVNRMNELLDQFNSNVIQVSTLINGLQEITVEIGNKLIEYSAETRDKFLLAQEDASENQDRRLVEITRTIETLQKVFMRSEDEYIKRTQANLLIAMREHVQTIHKEYLKEAENIAAIMERIRLVSDRMGTDVENMHKSFIDEQKNTGKMLKDMYKQIGNTMNSVSSNSDIQMATISKISATMENTAEVITDVKHKELLELKKAVNTGIEGIVAHVSSFNEDSLRITEAIESSTASNERAIEKLTSTMKNSIKAISNVNSSVNDINSSIKGLESSVLNSAVAVGKAINDTAAQQVDETQDTRSIIEQSIEEHKNIIQAIKELSQANQSNTNSKLEPLLLEMKNMNDKLSELFKDEALKLNNTLTDKDSDNK